MFSLFQKKEISPSLPLATDIHSHLLTGLDDGAKSWAETVQMIQTLKSLGYKKFVTTPHIMSDVYRNEPTGILAKLNELEEIIQHESLSIQVEAAAEYYLDENLIRQIAEKKKLLTFGKKYLLFETNFWSEPLPLKEFIFQATSQGYSLVLAHPERYEFMTLAKAEDLRNRGVLFQINSLSIMGFYSRPVQKMAYQLIDRGWVEFLGTDCHSMLQADFIREHQQNDYYQKALRLPLLNRTL